MREQAFVVGEHYAVDKCEVEYSCRYSELVFLSEDKFVLEIFCGVVKLDAPSIIQMGKYKVKGEILYLDFVKAGNEISSNDKMNCVLMKPLKFSVTSCGGKVVLKSDVKEFTYGSRDVKREKWTIEDFKQAKYWAKVREELNEDW